MVQGARPRRLSIFQLILLVAVGGLAIVLAIGHSAPPRREVGLFTSLPILWRETPDIAGLLQSDAPPHWAAAVLGGEGTLRPLDTLAGKDGTLALPHDALLVLAQPRPLSPQENVALDDWVRRGGRVVLFADPMLTAHSAFALGDKRRPQDIALLSPILARWGLELRFQENQSAEPREVPLFGAAVPVELPGHFVSRRGGLCTLQAGGLAARCRIGSGQVVALADAALLDNGTSGDEPSRRAMLTAILRAASR